MTPQAPTRPGGREYLSQVFPRLSADAVARTGSARANNPARPVPANDAAVSDYTAEPDTAGSDDTCRREHRNRPSCYRKQIIQAA